MLDQFDYNSLLNSTAEGIWAINLEGNIIFVNDAGMKLFGYTSKDQMLGKNSHELVHHKRADGTPYPRAECPIYKAFQAGISVRLEDEVLWRADGSYFHADYTASPIRKNGEIVGTVTTFVDNTERRKIQSELLRSQEWLAATLKSIGDAVIATSADSDPRIVFMNQVAEKLTGWSLAEARGKLALETFNIINQHTRQPAVNPVQRVLTEGRTVGLANHTVLISKDKQEFVIEDSASPIRNEEGKIVGVVLVFRDVTELSMARNVTEQNEKKLSALADSMPQIVWSATSAGSIDFFNLRMQEYTGLKASELEKNGWIKVIHPEDVALIDFHWKKSLATGCDLNFQFRLRRGSDGAYRWHIGRGAAIRDENDNIIKWYGSNADIHDHITATKDAIDVLESMSDAFFSLDNDWNIVRVNSQFEAISEISRQELLGKNFFNVFLPAQGIKSEKYFNFFRKAMLERVPISFEEYIEPLKIWTRVRAFPKAEGGVAVFFTDFTNYKLAQQKLMQNEERLRIATESAKIGTYVFDVETQCFAFSKITCEILGLPLQTTHTLKDVEQNIHPDDRRSIGLELAKLSDRGSGGYFVSDIKVRGPDCQTRHVFTTAQSQCEENAGESRVVSFIGMTMDITERVQLQEELAIAKTKADQANHSKSAFLANMSHEIRTPLGAILGFSELLKDDSLPAVDRDQYIDIIARNGQSLTRIIDDILDLAKVEAGKLDIEVITFSLYELMFEVVDLF